MHGFLLTDGRDCVAVLESMAEHVHGLEALTIVDDSGDHDNRRRLAHLAGRTFAAQRRQVPVEVRSSADDGHRVGYTEAVRAVYRAAVAVAVPPDDRTVRPVFVTEDDFRFLHRVELDLLGEVVTGRPGLAQLVFRRQEWYDHERRAGGVLESASRRASRDRRRYGLRAMTTPTGIRWTEHRLFWSNNPHVLPAWALVTGWPDGPYSEARKGDLMFDNDPGLFVGYLDGPDGGPLVHHVGHERSAGAHGY